MSVGKVSEVPATILVDENQTVIHIFVKFLLLFIILHAFGNT